MLRMRDALQHAGWSYLQGVTRTEFLGLAGSLGTPWTRSGGTVEYLRVQTRENATPWSLSALHGLGEFPLHTDFAHDVMPPRYVLLRSSAAGTVRPTTLQSLSAIAISSAARRILQRRVWVARGGPIPFYAPVLFGDGTYVRWDSACMSPSCLAMDARHAWTECLASAQPVQFDWDMNTVLVVDNWRVLHGRGGHAMRSDGDRLIERIIVS
jgi:alpha-ketoglutarate-dependent taurine dioxygenase